VHKENGKFVAPWFGSQFITFMVKPYYIYGCSVYYIYGQILLHLWLVFFLHLWLKVITFMVSVTFMVNFYYIYGWYYIYGFYYIYGWYNLDPVRFPHSAISRYTQKAIGMSQSKNCMHNSCKGYAEILTKVPVKMEISIIMMTTKRFVVFWISRPQSAMWCFE